MPFTNFFFPLFRSLDAAMMLLFFTVAAVEMTDAALANWIIILIIPLIMITLIKIVEWEKIVDNSQLNVLEKKRTTI